MAYRLKKTLQMAACVAGLLVMTACTPKSADFLSMNTVTYDADGRVAGSVLAHADVISP